MAINSRLQILYTEEDRQLLEEAWKLTAAHREDLAGSRGNPQDPSVLRDDKPSVMDLLQRTRYMHSMIRCSSHVFAQATCWPKPCASLSFARSFIFAPRLASNGVPRHHLNVSWNTPCKKLCAERRRH